MRTIHERHAEMRALTAGMTVAQVIEALELIIAEGPNRDESTRCASAFLVDELTDRSTSVRAALDAWEFDLHTEESSEQVAVRVARSVLYLYLHPDSKRANHREGDMYTVTMRIGNDTCTTTTTVSASTPEEAADKARAAWSGAGVKVESVVAKV